MSALLCFDAVTYTLSEGRKLVASGEVEAGQILQVTGVSGSGKSTLLRILARLLQRESGTMTFNGQPDTHYNPQVWRTKVHYLSQKPAMTTGSVWQNIIYPFTLRIRHDVALPEKAAVQAQLLSLGLTAGVLDQEVNLLSWGEKQRVALIRSLLINPSVLLMDEPTASLDADSRQVVMELTAHWIAGSPNRAVVLVSHNDEEVPGVPIRYLKLT